MKKLMTAALALTMVGGAAFAQKNTKQEVKQENKAAEVKTIAKKKKVTAAKKVETAKKVEVAK